MLKKSLVLSVFSMSMAVLNPRAQAAYYSSNTSRGLETQTFQNQEECVIPKNLPLVSEQKASKKQKSLCEIDFYDESKIKLEAKGNSTNPGVLILDASKRSSDGQFKKIAKFKQSVTCSYTPSILVYFQMSQFLGGAGNVPASVIRTMDLDEHKKIYHEGLSTPIAQMWHSFDAIYTNSTSRAANVLTADKSHLYGGLMVNPRGEERYASFNGPIRGVPYEERMQRSLMKSDGFLVVSHEGPLAALFSEQEKTLAVVAQKVQWARDMGDLVVLDTLFNQQDRPGNIHSEKKLAVLRGQDVKLVDAGKASAEEKTAGVSIDVLLMKDNDCGVNKTNRFRDGSVLEAIRHIHPKTYARVLRLAEALAAEKGASERPIREYFLKEMLYNPEDFEGGKRSFTANLEKAASILKGNCESGLLKLDADIEVQMGLKAEVTDCAIRDL